MVLVLTLVLLVAVTSALVAAGWWLDVGGPLAAAGELWSRHVPGRDMHAQLNVLVDRSVVTGLDGTKRLPGQLEIRASPDAPAVLGGTWDGLASDCAAGVVRFASAHGVRVDEGTWVSLWLDPRLGPRRLRRGRLFVEPTAAAPVRPVAGRGRVSTADERRPRPGAAPTLHLPDRMSPSPTAPQRRAAIRPAPTPDASSIPGPTLVAGEVVLRGVDGVRDARLTAHRNEVGREPGAALPLPASCGASRRHATVWLDDESGHWMLGDRGSLNGTYVDDRRLDPRHPVRLAVGQRIVFGDIAAAYAVVGLRTSSESAPVLGLEEHR